MAASSSSPTVEKVPPQHQVSIHTFGTIKCFGFSFRLLGDLIANNINATWHYVRDEDEDLEVDLKRIEESSIAVVIFSQKYTKNGWCLRELAKIGDLVEQGRVMVVPVKYDFDMLTVKGEFLDAMRKIENCDGITMYKESFGTRWKSSLGSWFDIQNIDFNQMLADGSLWEFQKGQIRDESIYCDATVDKVIRKLQEITLEGSQNASVDPSEKSDFQTSSSGEKNENFGIKQSVKELEEKLDLNYIKNQVSSSSPTVEEVPPQHQVSIHIFGTELCFGFVSGLFNALKRNNINVFFYRVQMSREYRGQPLEVQLKTIEESRIAVVIFSERYTKSTWCLRELARIGDCVEEGKLMAIPLKYDFFDMLTVKGEFLDAMRKIEKRDDNKSSILRHDLRSGNLFKNIEAIVEEVKRKLKKITSEGSQKAYVDPSETSDIQTSSSGENNENYRIKQSVKELKENIYIDQTVDVVKGSPKAYVDPTEGTENPRDKDNEFPTCKFESESSSSDAKTNADFLDRTSTNSGMDSNVKPSKIQVFINFRGIQLRNNFIGYLVDALRRSEINVFIDNQEQRGEDLSTLFKRIEDSGIAIVVFSSRYTESKWCLDELVKIKERVHEGLLKVLPIYYKVTPTNVKKLKGEFGDYFRDQEYKYASDESKIKQWKEAIEFVSHKFALTFDKKSSTAEIDFVETIVKEVLRMLQAISRVESGQSSC